MPPSHRDVPSEPSWPHRPRRSDARRNYDVLLQAAREVFEESGANAPLDVIARRAGIGNATMYRHFPTRQDLIVAVYADEVTELCARGNALLEHRKPADALFDWLRAFIAHVSAKRELALAINDDRERRRSELFAQWHDAMSATAAALTSRAQQTGDVSPGIDAGDLLTLATGIALASADRDQVKRLINLITPGIQTPGLPPSPA